MGSDGILCLCLLTWTIDKRRREGLETRVCHVISPLDNVHGDRQPFDVIRDPREECNQENSTAAYCRFYS